MNIKKWLFLIFLAMVLGYSGLHAQQKVLTLDDAIKIALANNPEIKIARIEVEKSKARVDEAFGYALPSVDVSGMYYHFLEKPKMAFPDFVALLNNSTYQVLFDENIIPEDNSKYLPIENVLQSFVLSNNYEAKAELTQIIFSSAVFEGIGASKIYEQTSEEAMRGKIAYTVLGVKQAFYGVLYLRERLDILNDRLKNAEENLNSVKAMKSEGLISEFTELQAEVQVENLKPVIIQLENSLKAAMDGLKMTIGISPLDEIEIAGELQYDEFSGANKDELVNHALEKNFDIKTLELKKEVDKAIIELDVSEYWPTIAGFANYTLGGTADDFNFQNYNSAMIGLNFTINLFSGGRTSNKVQQSTLVYQQTEEQLRQLKDAIKMQIKEKLLELERVSVTLDAQSRNVQLAERAYKLATIRYDEGTGTQLEIKNADIDLQEARTNRLESIYSYMVTVAQLEQLLGNVKGEYLNFKQEN